MDKLPEMDSWMWGDKDSYKSPSIKQALQASLRKKIEEETAEYINNLNEMVKSLSDEMKALPEELADHIEWDTIEGQVLLLNDETIPEMLKAFLHTEDGNQFPWVKTNDGLAVGFSVGEFDPHIEVNVNIKDLMLKNANDGHFKDENYPVDELIDSFQECIDIIKDNK